MIASEIKYSLSLVNFIVLLLIDNETLNALDALDLAALASSTNFHTALCTSLFLDGFACPKYVYIASCVI